MEDLCRKLRAELGRYRWDEWRQVSNQMGLSVISVCDPAIPPACLINDTIIIRKGINERSAAYLVWHEIAHYWLHPGRPSEWLAKPCGAILLAEFERQANEFAETFPVWE